MTYFVVRTFFLSLTSMTRMSARVTDVKKSFDLESLPYPVHRLDKVRSSFRSPSTG